MVADHGKDPGIEFAKVETDQQLSQAVMFFRCHDNDLLLSVSGEGYTDSFRKNGIELPGYDCIMDITGKFSTHKKTACFLFNEFMVFDDVAVMGIQNPGDLAHQPGLVLTVD